MATKPIIAIAGLGCETSSFTPRKTAAEAFHPRRGQEIFDSHTFLRPGSSLGDAAIWKGVLIGHALPGGIVTREAFEKLSAEILERLRNTAEAAGRLDGLWYDIHGAMCVEGIDDSEAELLRRIRTVIGPDVLVSASMDLHGNVSRDLVHQADLITVYRTAPHIDVAETCQRACRNLVGVLTHRPPTQKPPRPLKAWVPVPVLLPGEQTSTRLEPATSLYSLVPGVEAATGVLDAGIWIGYAWADEPRNRAAIVVTGWDENAVASGAEKLARAFWRVHREFKFVAPTGTLQECLDAALHSKKRPFFISDSGDNPTAGGSGDVTWTLQHLLLDPRLHGVSAPVLFYASLPVGHAAIQNCLKAGKGSIVSLHNVGASVDDLHAGPLTLHGRIHAIKSGDIHARTEVVLHHSDTNIYIILTQLRKPYHKEVDFLDLDLDIRAGGAELVVVKIGYLEPDLYNLQKGWMLALTPGGVDQDLERLGHKRIRRPMWPFDKERSEEPDLGARMIAASNEPLDGIDE
ncbi:Microcystin LR degradation protein MlrC [Teratosphaeria destructans]|uniref:Microcystin LR degradation protein MlrC n=1 Tax=Teratosphaeria destructans TaxID=418781 RepID=A0A9W7SUM4_9PEZI|nr:Microcystin LR degradation protein MlrC [Teratosphaeria destructans]